MPVSEVPIPKNGILALAHGSHLRRVFPVPRDYRRQSNTVPITGSEVQPKWSIACGLNNLQKIRDGEPLDGKASAESDFASDEDDDFLD